MSEAAFLQHTREGALYAVPPAGLGVGDVLKAAKPVSPDHETVGEVLAVAKNGLAIVHWPKAARVEIRKTPTNQSAANPTVATTRSYTPMSTYENLRKAAHSGLDEYGNEKTWNGALEELAKSQRREGETMEQSFARVVREHPDGRAMRSCYEKARRRATYQ